MEPVECVWVEPTGKAVRTLRRYQRGEDPCSANPGYDYHQAAVELGDHFDVVWRYYDDAARAVATIDNADYAGDPLWPTHCACGYEFADEDHWQVVQEPTYAAEDGRLAWTSPAHGRKPTPGAMFDTFWRADLRKEDGLAISVVCPDGSVWCVDDRASSGGHWQRTGTPPAITVTPSILTPTYHGFLTNGVFNAC